MSGFLAFVDGHTQFFCSRYLVIVCSSRRTRFSFRTYFHSVPVDPNACSQSPVPVVPFELCAFVYALFRVSFYRVTTVMKRKRKLTEELKSKYSCFRNDRDDLKAECLVRKPGTTVSVANQGALDLRAHVEWEKHKKAVRGEMSLAKVTSFCCIGKQIR